MSIPTITGLILCCVADTITIDGPPIQQVGDPTGMGEETLYRVTDLVVDESRNLWVLDAGDRQVKKFSLEGDLDLVVGREGDGPGEFRFPTGLTVDSLIHVMDPSRSRVVRFALDGMHRETRRLPQPLAVPFAELFEMRGGSRLGITAARFNRGAPGGAPNVLVLHLADELDVDTVAQFPAGAALWHAVDAAAPWGLFPSPYGAGGAAAASGDSLFVVADGLSATVTWYAVERDGTRSMLQIDSLGIPGRPVTTADLDGLKERIRGEVDDAPRDFGLQAQDFWSPAADAFFDSDERLWLRSAADSDREIWTRLDGASHSRYVFVMPVGLAVKAVAEDVVYGITRTDLDVPVIHAYALPGG